MQTVGSREWGAGGRERVAGSRELCKCNSFFRHCEPPLLELQELLNHDKGARQPAFDFLSGIDAKDKLRIATPFCRTKSFPNYQGLTAKRLAMTSSNC